MRVVPPRLRETDAAAILVMELRHLIVVEAT
jgi:hypothetical protein